jgi:hypothetical protein
MKSLEAVAIILIIALAVSIYFDFTLYNNYQQLNSAFINLNQSYNELNQRYVNLSVQNANLQKQLTEIEAQILQSNNPWLFSGAYAVYSGQAQGYLYPPAPGTPKPTLFNETVRLEVLEFNGTHAKWFFSYQEGSTAVVGIIDYTGDWVSPRKEYTIFEMNLTRMNETDIFIDGLGSKNCIVYQNEFGGFVAYVDQNTGWPIKFHYVSGFHTEYTIDLNLIESNIPGLIIT